MSKERNFMYSKKDSYFRKINSASGLKILENLKILYGNCKPNQKSNILANVSKLFTRKYLNRIGFNVNKKIYNNSKRKAEDEEFNLNEFKRHKPLSKLKTRKEIVDNIIEHIKEYSIQSNNTYYNNKIYYLQQNKNYIYEKYLEKI